MNIVLLLAHSIEEHDQLKLLSGLGYDVFSIGGYINPGAPHDPKRPPLPEVPYHPDLQAAVDELGTPDNLDAAKRHIPDAILDWADVIICHHYEHTWLVPQWDRIKHKRVIWRTVGQSVEHNERMMAPLRADGLEIVRYSPKERNIPGYAGEDALIRFWKDPDEWGGWHGSEPAVINITQHLVQREPYTNYGFWAQATAGLADHSHADKHHPYRMPLGPGSEAIGGEGELSYDDMKTWLRSARAYLYTGTQPASYTLGLLEATMTGIPVVSIGPSWMKIFPYGPDLFEGHEFAAHFEDDPARARKMLQDHLDNPRTDTDCYRHQQAQTRQFHKDVVGAQWKAYLGAA